MSSPNLHQRLISVMHTMGAVGKGGQTNYGDKFAYHRIDDIDDKLRGALVEHGVVATITEIRDRKLEHFDEVDKYGKARTTWYAECLIVIELVNADNPEERKCIQGWGQGLDFSDKATGKAISYAAKSAYLSAFHLRGQPDNEEENIVRAPAKKEQPQEQPVDASMVAACIDIINVCSKVEDLAGVGEKIHKESAGFQKAVESSYAKQWVRLIEQCNEADALASIANALKSEPQGVKAAASKPYLKRRKELEDSAG